MKLFHNTPLSSLQRALCLNIILYNNKKIKHLFGKCLISFHQFFSFFRESGSHVEESYITVRADIFLRFMPVAGAIVRRIEYADSVLDSGTALIKDVADYFLTGLTGGDAGGAVVAVL